MSLFRAELISIADDVAKCWIEINNSLRVASSVPSEAVQDLNLKQGDGFLWHSVEKYATALPSDDLLKQEFHEKIK